MFRTTHAWKLSGSSRGSNYRAFDCERCREQAVKAICLLKVAWKWAQQFNFPKREYINVVCLSASNEFVRIIDKCEWYTSGFHGAVDDPRRTQRGSGVVGNTSLSHPLESPLGRKAIREQRKLGSDSYVIVRTHTRAHAAVDARFSIKWINMER